MMLLESWISVKYFSETRFKAAITVLNSAEYTITRKESFCFLVYKSCLGTAAATATVVVFGPAESSNILAVSSLPFHP